MWKGGFVKPKGGWKTFGDDNGCFKAALESVRKYGGVLEHPALSNAFAHFGILKPSAKGGWGIADTHGGFTCIVNQRNYGHPARKMTCLYVCKTSLPNLIWGEGKPTRVVISNSPQDKIARKLLPFFPKMGKASLGAPNREKKLTSNDETLKTPPAFRNLLISIARSVYDKPEPPIRTLFAMPDPVPLKNPLGTVVDLETNPDSS